MILSPALAPLSATMMCASIVVAGCATSGPATAYTPITGIQISAADIVGGHGCGPRTGQVYKYAAIVAYPTDGGAAGVPLASAVFDCFADGIFSNLPLIDGGPQLFAISIYAYDKSSFPRALDCPSGAAPCPGEDAGAVLAWTAAANSTATCTAEEFPGVTAIATCGALSQSQAHSSPSDAAAE